jgi:hypothetical protein
MTWLQNEFKIEGTLLEDDSVNFDHNEMVQQRLTEILHLRVGSK